MLRIGKGKLPECMVQTPTIVRTHLATGDMHMYLLAFSTPTNIQTRHYLLELIGLEETLSSRLAFVVLKFVFRWPTTRNIIDESTEYTPELGVAQARLVTYLEQWRLNGRYRLDS